MHKIFRDLVEHLMNLFMDHSEKSCILEHPDQETCYSIDHPSPCDYCSILVKLSEINQLVKKLA